MAEYSTPVHTVAYKGWRSILKGPCHYCARCGSRVPISDLEWQFGILVCKKWNCFDYGNHGLPLIGQREAAVTHALDNLDNEHELQPDPKLIEPATSGNDPEDDLFY